MGATFIEDQEILLVIEDNCKQLGLQPLAPEPSEQEVAIQEFSNLLPDTLTTKKQEEDWEILKPQNNKAYRERKKKTLKNTFFLNLKEA